MFFEQLSEIPNLSQKTQCAVFVLLKNIPLELKNAVILQPETKTVITIEQVRETLNLLTTKQLEPRFIMIRPADLLSEEAANAILKNLEEPKENVHFLLVTDDPSKLLPTILSRAEVFVWRGGITPLNQIDADEKVKLIAKKLLAAKPVELVNIAEELTKKKDGVRARVLETLSVTIEMAYKTYFLTGKSAFLTKIPKLITAYDNISKNGHIKLHLVADLL